MPFEQFDKKIKEAAENHHPAYDEQAWTKMEKLLDKHLPQQDDNRRRVLFFILVFLGLGAAGLLITKPWKKDTATIAANQQVKKIPTPASSADQTEKKGSAPHEEEDTSGTAKKTTLVSVEDVQNPPVITKASIENGENRIAPVVMNKKTAEESGFVLNNSIPSRDRNKNNSSFGLSPVTKSKKDQTVAVQAEKYNDQSEFLEKKPGTTIPVTEARVKTVDISPDPVVVKKEKSEPEKSNGVIKTNEAIAVVDNKKPTSDDKKDESKKELAKIEEAGKQTIKAEEPSISKNAGKESDSQRKKLSGFFLSFSAGPDISFVSKNKAGEVKAVVGAGIGYSLKDRWTVRTGFYSGRKVYTATADAYDPPAGFSALYPYLEKVDADCKIYEIPISVSYNFGKKSSRNWFVSAGLSTFLMKEETYNYYYKYTPQGNTYTNKWTIKNKNSHFFSVATISAGYKKDISKRLTLVAEPYMKVPVGGVGYGKVKLNSGGVLFTIGIKPF